jgi:hypothetical protein
MGKVILAICLALGAGAAQAADYVVVKSTAPDIKPGLALNGGQRVDLDSGQTLTLIGASGDVTMLKGANGGAIAPARRTTQADAGKLDALRVLIDPPPPGRTFGGRRSGVCPDPSNLKTLDDILAAQKATCTDVAKQALDALAANP